MANTSKKTTKSTAKTVESAAEKKRFYKINNLYSKSPFSKVSTTAILILGLVLFGGIAVFTTFAVMAHNNDTKASADEYAYLRGLASDVEQAYDDDGVIKLSALHNEMYAINPDYVCWIRIGGTSIDHPVVRGQDNEKYLGITFNGEENRYGAIFMDYRNTGEKLPHIIIYGHNARDGSMFTDLKKFLDPTFLEQNRTITLIVNGAEVEFEIYSARQSDIEDPAYYLDLGTTRNFTRFADRVEAPLRATQILTLSTCVSGGNDDARMIVQAYR